MLSRNVEAYLKNFTLKLDGSFFYYSILISFYAADLTTDSSIWNPTVPEKIF